MNTKEKRTKEGGEELKELVLARIEVMPKNFKLSIGNKGTFTKSELITHIKDGDEIGMQVIKMQVSFIKALVSGKLTEALVKNE
jgi:hypothetical protein